MGLAIYLIIFLLSIAVLYYQATKSIPSRLNSDQAPKSRFELVPACASGLPTRADGIDIIFVHGLGSNPDSTWRATKHATRQATTADIPEEAATDNEQFVNWVSDFLPSDLLPAVSRDVRLFFYNYDSYWKRDAVHTRLTNLGNELLEHIGGIRMSETEQNRSLIFVAHSFGGLVVKRALVQARASRDFGHVAEHAQTIIFLGTPHRGTSFGLWGWLAAKGLQPLGSNPSILADLEYDSFSLHDLHKDFMAVAPDDLRVFNFFEKRPTCILRLWFVRLERFCVHEQSATYEGRNVRNIGLSVDHYGLNKFASKNESYQSILSKLTESIRASARPVKHHYAVPLGRVDTYTERVGLSAELEQKLHIRHKKASVPYAVSLYGLGGVGKSQLALDYAEKHKHDYNPILWIDATDEETVRSSFKICAAELGLTVEGGENQGSIITDAGVRAVLRWLCDRSEADDEWLLIVDNADDVSWGIQKVMPRGNRGRVIITSRDEQSTKLVGGTCESVRVGDMSPPEGRALLLRHLQLDEELAPGDIKEDCDRVVKKLEFLALAIDIAGAYIGSHSPCDKALQRYLADYERHRDELLQMDFFRGLLATEKTVWTVWDTTLEKIAMENKGLLPDVLLTFLAHFKGGIIQDEMFRLASLGMEKVKANMGEEESEGMPFELQQFLPLAGDKWDDFRYQQGCRLLLRYSLLQRVDGGWAGVTMHGLVRWRAMLSHRSRPWRQWYMVFVLAACYQNIEEEQPEFRRHLVGHLPDIHGDDGQEREYFLRYPSFIGETIGRIYYDEGRWEEAEKLQVQVMETRKTKLGADHPDTLMSMANLASTFWSQGRWEEAEKLQVQVMETRKTKLGADHPDTLRSMANLALTFWSQGRWEEAEKLQLQVMETSKIKLGADHPDILRSMVNLASTFSNQGRLEEAEKLEVQVMETSKIKLGADHPSTLTSMINLASTYRNQGRWEEAEKLEVQVMETSKMKLGVDHPSTLTSIGNLASTYMNQGRWEEAEKLEVQVMETRKTKLGADHPDTLTGMANLALTFWSQGRWEEAEKLQLQVMETSKIKLGADHPDTLRSMANLASTFSNQGRLEEAEKLEVQVMETSKIKLGADHPSTLTSMANLASTYRNQGRWEEAEKLEVQVMETRKTKLGADHPDTLMSIGNLASTYRNQGRWKEAEKLQLQVMETSKIKLGADHPDSLTGMANLALTFWSQGRWEEAEKLQVQVMETSKMKLGVDHPSTLTSMANLASTFWSQGRWEEAEKLQVQVMETNKMKLGVDHPSTLTSMANLASTYRNQGRWEEAEKLEMQVMETRKTKLGADHPDTLRSMANLALTFWNQGRWEEAEKLQLQVMETSKIKLGADHPSTLTSMANLASTYRNQGRWEEAEKLEVQVMETSKIKLGADHLDTLTGMANLALTFWSQGRWEEAEKLQLQVMETSKIKLGADHPDTLRSMANLASTFWSQDRLEEAEKLEVQVMETNKMKLGVDHPSTLTSMINLASTYRNQGRWEEAEKLEMQVMETRKTKLGADHPDTLRSMANLASTLWSQGRWEEAEKLQLQVMETSKMKLGADHLDTLTSMANLAFTWKNQGRHADALALMKNCAQAQQRVLGDEHPYTLMSLAIVAKWSS